ncbi:MAG TPA: hypothetical protein VMV07_19445, partial [Streptosporangiaceae bacterium]|nr:hypothetical protein [Streptosporangiaceae bacterium]
MGGAAAAGRVDARLAAARSGASVGETSISAGRTKTREGARYRKLARRIGKDKAQVAVSNTQLKVYYTLLSSPGMR